MKSGRCHNRGPGRTRGVIFTATAHVGARFSCCSHNLFTSRTLKIHSWKLFVYGKIFAHGKIKSGRKSLVKRKEKESRPKEERKSTILSRKEKYSFVKVTGAGGAPCWRPDFD